MVGKNGDIVRSDITIKRKQYSVHDLKNFIKKETDKDCTLCCFSIITSGREIVNHKENFFQYLEVILMGDELVINKIIGLYRGKIKKVKG